MMNNKNGYTILESVIAMLLVSIIVSGIFSSLMAARRAIMEPSYREDMMYAVESANSVLKNFVDNAEIPDADDIQEEMCQAGALDLLSVDSKHDLKCRLPFVCDKTQDSDFYYEVFEEEIPVSKTGETAVAPVKIKRVVFTITCNREKL